MCSACSIPFTRRQHLGLWLGLLGTLPVIAPRTDLIASAAAQTKPALPSEIAGVTIPDSDLAKASVILMQAEAARPLFNHCLRTFILASLFAKQNGWSFDAELVFVSAMLHDIGLIPKYSDPFKTFEHAGADFAETFVLQGNFTPDRAEKVWKGILLHAGKVPADAEPDVAFVQAGTAMDVFGRSLEIVDEPAFQAILAAVPRLAFKAAFLQILAEHVESSKNPDWTKSFTENPPTSFQNNRWPE